MNPALSFTDKIILESIVRSVYFILRLVKALSKAATRALLPPMTTGNILWLMSKVRISQALRIVSVKSNALFHVPKINILDFPGILASL